MKWALECLSSYTDSGYPSYSKEKCSHITYSVCWPQGRGISDTAGGSRQRGGRAPPVCGGRAEGAPGPPGPELQLSPGGRGQDWSARPIPGQAQRCSSLIIRQMFLITLKLLSVLNYIKGTSLSIHFPPGFKSRCLGRYQTCFPTNSIFQIPSNLTNF